MQSCSAVLIPRSVASVSVVACDNYWNSSDEVSFTSFSGITDRKSELLIESATSGVE